MVLEKRKILWWKRERERKRSFFFFFVNKFLVLSEEWKEREREALGFQVEKGERVSERGNRKEGEREIEIHRFHMDFSKNIIIF